MFVKVYGFLSLVKNMGKILGKNIGSKCSQEFLGHAK